MKTGATVSSDPRQAVKEIVPQIFNNDLALVLFFCTADYDPEIVSSEMRAAFSCPVIGCTSAGEIHKRFQKGGLVAVSFSWQHFSVAVEYIDNLDEFNAARAERLVTNLNAHPSAQDAKQHGHTSTFALTLIDGLSVQEEHYIGALYGALHGVPLIGGSAGDSLEFKKTTVFCNEHFGSNSAVIALINTDYPIRMLKHMHIGPTKKEMVITNADPNTRTIYEIDGGLAAEEYANALGYNVEELTPAIFSKHPLMLLIGSDWYVRAIQKVNDDKSMTFFCAIEEGIPLTIGKSENYIESLSRKVDDLKGSFGEIALTLGCDCILRRLEVEEGGFVEETEALLQQLSFVGFSTYGEQFGGVHINQTLTGVVFGK